MKTGTVLLGKVDPYDNWRENGVASFKKGDRVRVKSGGRFNNRYGTVVMTANEKFPRTREDMPFWMVKLDGRKKKLHMVHRIHARPVNKRK